MSRYVIHDAQPSPRDFPMFPFAASSFRAANLSREQVCPPADNGGLLLHNAKDMIQVASRDDGESTLSDLALEQPPALRRWKDTVAKDE